MAYMSNHQCNYAKNDQWHIKQTSFSMICLCAENNWKLKIINTKIKRLFG